MRAVNGPPKGSKREKISSYASPYVAKAQQQALQRARDARKHLPRNGFVQNEWDATPKAPGGVFDPSIRKKEIFRLGARQQDSSLLNRSVSSDKPSSRTPALTMRTNLDNPIRRPQSSSSHRQPSRSPSPPSSSSVQHQPQQSQSRSPARSSSPSPPPPPPPLASSSRTATPSTRVRITPSSGDAIADEREVKQRQESHDQYSRLLRERLRTMLYQRIGLADHTDEDGNPIPGSASSRSSVNRSKRVVRSTSSYYQDSQAAMTSEMMRNMAHIMKAVGDLVANVNTAKDDRRRRRKLFNPARNQSSPYMQPEDLMAQHADHLRPPPPPAPTTQTPVPGAAPSVASCGQGSVSGPDIGAGVVWDMSKAVAQVKAKQVPLSKSGVMDLVLAKLQAIEQSEREIMVFLQAHQHSGLVHDITMQPVTSNVVDSSLSPAPTTKVPTRSRPGLTAERIAAATGCSPATKTSPQVVFPRMKQVGDRNESTYTYLRDLQAARKMREVAFLQRNSTLCDTATTLSDMLYDMMVHSTVKDLDHLVDDYTQTFVKTI